MNILKTVMLAAAVSLSFSSFAANANTYDFSYTFGDGNLLTGSLSGTLSGLFINNISDVTVSLNGTQFSGGSLYSAAWNTSTGNYDNTIPAIVSTNAALNNFIFADANVPANFVGVSNYFTFVNDPINGSQVTAINFNTPDSLGNAAGSSESPINSSWSLVAAPVPEPKTYALMLAGLAFVSAASARRSRQG